MKSSIVIAVLLLFPFFSIIAQTGDVVPGSGNNTESPNDDDCYNSGSQDGYFACALCESDTDSVSQTYSIMCNSYQRYNNSCDTVCNGEASITPINGVPPYVYLWNTGVTDSMITSLCAGVYSCTVTDFMGDTGSVTFTITDSIFINTGTVAGPAAVYSGDTATYTVNNNTGSYYTWSASGGTIISGISAYQVTVVWGPAGMGTISTYEVDSNFCVGDVVSLNVVIGSTSSLEEEQEQHQTAAIYPNPFTESTVIEFENTTDASFELRVLDLSGKLIRERSGINGTRFVFRRDGMANGIYFLELRSKDQVFLGKLVLE